MPDAASQATPPDVDVRLTRQDFLYYNWVLAFERPILPFFLYTFTFLTLVSLLGLWPDGRLYAAAALLPLLGYALVVWLSSHLLWRKLPEELRRRSYRFRPESYRAGREDVPYASVARVLESRRALYLLRRDGRADLLPKRLLPDGAESFLKRRIGEWKGSSFL